MRSRSLRVSSTRGSAGVMNSSKGFGVVGGDLRVSQCRAEGARVLALGQFAAGVDAQGLALNAM